MTDEVNEEAERFEDAAADLDVALAALELRLRHLRLRELHFTGDLTLFGFLDGVRGGAGAVRHLVRESDFGYAASPNARSAFEAAQDAMLLVTEADYNAAGARARVFERLEFADLKVQMHDAFGGEAPASDYGEAESDIRTQAAKWDANCPGRGQLLLNALALLQPQFAGAKKGKRHPAHWSGLSSRRRIATAIGMRINEPEFTKSMIAAYAQLSRASHPRLRIESWERSRSPEGHKQLRRSDRSIRIILGVAGIAAHMATRAFDRVKAGELPQTEAGEPG